MFVFIIVAFNFVQFNNLHFLNLQLYSISTQANSLFAREYIRNVGDDLSYGKFLIIFPSCVFVAIQRWYRKILFLSEDEKGLYQDNAVPSVLKTLKGSLGSVTLIALTRIRFLYTKKRRLIILKTNYTSQTKNGKLHNIFLIILFLPFIATV